MSEEALPATDPRSALRADCAACLGLCCVVPAFAASADFALDKPAGQPCPNLRADSRCGIHAELRPRGFAGCAAYDCFGAGQRVSQVTVGRDWRADRETLRLTAAVFPVVRQLLAWRVRVARVLAVVGQVVNIDGIVVLAQSGTEVTLQEGLLYEQFGISG